MPLDWFDTIVIVDDIEGDEAVACELFVCLCIRVGVTAVLLLDDMTIVAAVLTVRRVGVLWDGRSG